MIPLRLILPSLSRRPIMPYCCATWTKINYQIISLHFIILISSSTVLFLYFTTTVHVTDIPTLSLSDLCFLMKSLFETLAVFNMYIHPCNSLYEIKADHFKQSLMTRELPPLKRHSQSTPHICYSTKVKIQTHTSAFYKHFWTWLWFYEP